MTSLCHFARPRLARAGCLLAALACALLTTPAAPAADEDFWTWPTLLATGDGVAGVPRLHFWAEAQGRFNDDSSRLNQGVLRGALGWRLAPRTVLWAGYGWFPTRPQGSPDEFDEHRPWQQLTWRAARPVAGFGLSARLRLEQRIFESADGTAWRVRPFVKLTRPLGTSGRHYLALWEEPFAYLDDAAWGAESGFDQNRAFVGLGTRWSPLLRSEIGYMNWYIDRRGRADANNHVLLMTLFFDF